MPFSIRSLFKRHGVNPGAGPGRAQQLLDRGNAAEDAGESAEALSLYRQAVEIAPRFAPAHLNLGIALQHLGDDSAAVRAYQRALELDPDCAAAHFNLGLAHLAALRFEQAEHCLRTALGLRENFPEALVGLAEALEAGGRQIEALDALNKATAQRDRYEGAWMNAGSLLHRMQRLEEAESAFRRILAFAPDSAEAHFRLSNLLRSRGRSAEAEASYRRAVELSPQMAAAQQLALDAQDVLLLALNFTDRFTRAEVHAEHLAWARRLDSANRKLSGHANSRDPGRRLRIGYVSPDFRRHSVAYFIAPILARHDRRTFEVHCYPNVAVPDATTARLLALADHAHDLAGVGDAEAAERIRSDGIDILVDLAGHTIRHRLGVFALKPAPVQVSYLGYPNTTGLGTIDWRITDLHADPAGEGDEFHTERLARLPNTFLCFEPPQEAAAVWPPPSIARGHVTFGSFNALPKVTPDVIRLWAAILERVPDSRLLLKAPHLGDPNARTDLLGAFRNHGIGAERLILLPMDDELSTHLARYHDVDIGLDPFPFNGTTTTLEALWMGVPVVTITGDRHSARVGASILRNTGLERLIAATAPEYVALAAGLAGDRTRLIQLRRTMRERLQTSPVLDAAGFTATLEVAYRNMWRDWCARSPA